MLGILSIQIAAHMSHHSIPPNAPNQEVGHWTTIILWMGRVFNDPTLGATFKILMPSMALP